MDPEQLAQIALEAGRKARAVHQRHLGQVDPSDWDEKGTADFVTRVDLEAEEAIIGLIRDRCPGHQILAEESAQLGDPASVRRRFDAAEYLWVIDPLDGTTNFLHRYPAFAASVAVAHRGRLVAGAVVDGYHGTEWHAWNAGGAYRDGQPIRCTGTERLDHALVGTGFPFKVNHLLPRYLRHFDAILRRTSGIRRAGAAALDLCHLADGRFDGFWELWLAPWDIAAGVVIAREAGAIVTTLDGDPDIRAAGAIVGGTPAIHAQLQALLESLDD
ncbi:MAG: inositol monophosphatase family protein [Longimicrobiales bacterium]|nr:inositol monophosphatase family protein [Longimicrobiales bacterium]